MIATHIKQIHFQKRSAIYLIFIAISFAFLPVILANYIRQDDMKWQLWLGMKMREHYDYNMAFFQMVRPISFLFTFFTDMISYHMHNAVFVRLASLFLMMGIAYLIYRWLNKFHENKLFSLCYSIATCTLPAFQVYVATANYFFMIFSVFTAIISLFLIWNGFSENASLRNKILYLIGGAIFFMITFLNYSLSALFAWTLLIVPSINLPKSNQNVFQSIIQLFMTGIGLALVMLAYFVFVQKFHAHHHIATQPSRLTQIGMDHMWLLFKTVVTWHSNLWQWRTIDISNYIGISLIVIVLLIGSICNYFTNRQGSFGLHSIFVLVFNVLLKFLIVFSLFVICYLPTLFSPMFNINFRYTIATMPLLLYSIFWSVENIRKLLSKIPNHLVSKLFDLIFIFIAIFGVGASNFALECYIVGPQQRDFNYLREKLAKEVRPLLSKGNQVTIEIIWSPEEGYYYDYQAPNFEYGMRISQYPDMCIGAIVHILREMGFDFNYKESKSFRTDQEVTTGVPWGFIAALRADAVPPSPLQIPPGNPYPLVVIDMREVKPYRGFSLYQNWLKKIFAVRTYDFLTLR